MRPGIRGIASLIGVFLALWLGTRYLMPLIFPFLLGLGLALLAEPLVSFLCRRLRLPRSLSTGIGVTAVFAASGMLILMLAAFMVREMAMLAGVLPDLTQTTHSALTLLQNWLLALTERLPEGVRLMLHRQVEEAFSGGSALLDKAFSYVLGLAGSILTHVPDSALRLGTGVISGYMISAKLPGIRSWVGRTLPREKLKPVLRTLKQVKTVVGRWLLAQIKLVGVTLGLLAVGFLILRIPYGLLWAVGIALLDALPVLGTGIVLLPWSLVCFLQGDNARAVGLLGIYGLIALSRSVLEPKLVGRQLGLDPLATLFALYVGYRLWGIVGMILAPLLAVTAQQLLWGRREIPGEI